MKLRKTEATLELATSDVCRLLTEAICTTFSMFEHMEVYRITRTAHGRFRVDLEHHSKPTKLIATGEQGAAA
jgi:hypothetical protein